MRNNCHWVIVHHTRKESTTKKSLIPLSLDKDAIFDSIRGSSCWENYAESIIALVPSGDDLPDNFLKIFFRLRKGFEAEPLEVKWDIVTLNYELQDITDLHRKTKITYSDMLAHINKNFADKKYPNKILRDSISQKFKVTTGRVGQILLEMLHNGDLAKDKGKFGKWYIPNQNKLF